MKKLKILLIISLIFNIVAGVFAIRRLYYMRLDELNVRPLGFYAEVKRKSYAALPITANDIVIIGDSEVEYFNTQELLPGYQIKNRGIGGDNIRNLLWRLGDVIKGKPRKVFIEIGANDVLYLSAYQYKVYLQQVMDKFKKESPKTEIYLQSILPINRFGHEKVKYLNKILKDVSIIYNAHFIDLYTPMSENGLLNKKYDCGDGLHLNVYGYFAWANILKAYM